MKTFNSIIFLLFVSFVAIAQKDEKPYMVKTFSASAIKNLKINTSGGGLVVTGTSDPQARIEVYVQANQNRDDIISKEDLEERLKNYELSVSQDGNTIVAFAKNKTNNWGKKSLSIGFKAFMPQNITTDLNTSGGSISVKGITGNAIGRTSGGSIAVEKCKNKVALKTSGGSISAIDCSGDIDLSTSGGSISAIDLDGTIDLTTSGGSISLDNLKGNTKAITSGGSIKATELRGESMVKTSGGSITLREIYGTLDAATSSGSLDAEIMELGKSLNLSVSSGSMNVRMPMNKGMNLDCAAQKVNIDGMKNFDGEIDKAYVKGKLNGGGIPVSMKVSSGNLTVRGL
jgi:hypothetical protein